MDFQREQARLLEHTKEPHLFFDYDFPIWRCPDCHSLNRFVATFGEMCLNCHRDHTLDWEQYIVNEQVRAEWVRVS